MLVKYSLVVCGDFGDVIVSPINSLSESYAVNGRCRCWMGVVWLWHLDVLEEGLGLLCYKEQW